MSLKLKVLPLALAQIIAGSALTVAMAPVFAQSSTDSSGQTVQRVEITGSNIRRADAEIPSPVQVITADDMKKEGYTTVAEVLQHITANGQGTLSQGFSQAFAAGASGISLHGLTTAATLVLIDGHRMAPYPLSDDGQRSFVDVSNIPFDAVERIEVLKDGASATYGSDAMAGVVNIILKKSFVGTTVTAEGSGTQEGGGATVHASVMHGWGDYDADGYNAYVNLEYRHQDRITYDQREGDGLWQDLNLAPYGGVNKTPGVITPYNPQPSVAGGPYLTNPNVPFSGAANSSYFNPNSQCSSYAMLAAGQCAWQSPLAEIEPQTENINLLASVSKKLSGDWKLDVKGSLFDSKAEQYPAGGVQTYPQFFNPLVAVSAGQAPAVVGSAISQIAVPSTYPGNPFGTAAVLNGVIPGAPIPNTQTNSKAYRLVGDLSGSIGDWDINASLGYTRVTTHQDDIGLINVPALNAALNAPNGSAQQWNIYGGNSQALINSIFPTSSVDDISTLEFAEFHASRSLMQLPGGDLGFSTGVEFTHRELNAPAPPLIAEGIVNGNNAYASGTQNDSAAYAEIAAPVLKGLEIDGSVRADDFDNASGSVTPKAGFKWTPSPVFTLRGTVSKGFRAPNPAENGNSGQAYLAQTTNDPILCPNGPTSKGAVIAYCNYQPVILNQSNPDLQPEKSLSETLGVILEPIKGWSSTIDLYQVRITNQIVDGTPSSTPVRGTPISTLCSDGNGGTYTCTTPVGPTLYYPNTYVNANSTTTSGIEFDTRYKFKFGDYGNLTADLQWTHVMSYILDIPGQGEAQLAGTHGPFVIGGDTANPKDRVQLTLTYDKGPLSVATTFNYISGYNLLDPSYNAGSPYSATGFDTNCAVGGSLDGWFPNGNTPGQLCQVHSFLETDLTAHYKYNKQLTLNAGIINLFNQAPPVDVNSYGGGQLPYNPSMHLAGAIGRQFNAGLKYTF